MIYCEKCGRPKFSESSHSCPPLWAVWVVDEHISERGTYHENSAIDAVEKCAEEQDREREYCIAKGDTEHFFVTLESNIDDLDEIIDESEVLKIEVTGEFNPCYYGEKLDEIKK